MKRILSKMKIKKNRKEEYTVNASGRLKLQENGWSSDKKKMSIDGNKADFIVPSVERNATI
jgi:hypothetical protein